MRFQGPIVEKCKSQGAPASVVAALQAGEAVPYFWQEYEDYYNANFVGTKNIVDSCKKHGVKYLVYTSSVSTPVHTSSRSRHASIAGDQHYATTTL